MTAKTDRKPLEQVLVEELEASGRWACTNAPYLRYCDLYEAQRTGQPVRAYDLASAVQREMAYQGIV